MSKYRTAFLGTPEFAVPILRALIDDPRYIVEFVVTQPDRPAGRGQSLVAPSVKLAAEEYGIRVFQPASLKSIEIDSEASHQAGRVMLKSGELAAPLVSHINCSDPLDILVTAAYGNIIPVSLLKVGRAPMVNVHPSLLPRWRGAAPLQWAIFEGDRLTGVCLMQVEQGLDTGPVFAEVQTEISPSENLGSLHDRLAELGRALLETHLESIITGQLLPRAQDDSVATYAHKWEKADALVNWQEHADRCDCRIRASNPIPGARTFYRGEMVKIFGAYVVDAGSYPAASPGTVVGVEGDRIVVACGEGSFLALVELQLPGRKRLKAAEVLKGFAIDKGGLFSNA